MVSVLRSLCCKTCTVCGRFAARYNGLTQVHHGPLPVTPGTTLSWLGFSEESLLTSYDSEVCLQMLEHNLLGIHLQTCIWSNLPPGNENAHVMRVDIDIIMQQTSKFCYIRQGSPH